MWTFVWCMTVLFNGHDGKEPTDRLIPPNWQGNPWGPAANRARANGEIPPIPMSPLMLQWHKWGKQVLQDGEFARLGGRQDVRVDVRVVAATNRDLPRGIANGQFREDLYYRLKVIELTVPALRERRDEIPTLTDFFLARSSRKYTRPHRPLSDDLRQLFLVYDFPGNIRELENMIKRIVVLQDEQLVVGEIRQNLQKAAAAAQLAAAPQQVPVGAGMAAGEPGMAPRRMTRRQMQRSRQMEPQDEGM